MSQPIHNFGGPTDGPPLHLAVANGFPPQTYNPLVRALPGHYRSLSLPPRALWDDEQPQAGGWQTVADDLLAGLRQYKLQDVIAVGHSFGGVASMLAALEEPARFRALVLLDPTIVPPEGLLYIRQMQEQKQTMEIALVQAAQRRRRLFESKEDAFIRFRERSLFADWADETLWLYVEHNLRPLPDGHFTLVWSPEWEAYYFSTVYTGSWERLPGLRGPLPLLVLRGGNSDTFLPQAEEMMRDILPEAAYRVVEGHGHLFPQSAPQQTAAIITQWLGQMGL